MTNLELLTQAFEPIDVNHLQILAKAFDALDVTLENIHKLNTIGMMDGWPEEAYIDMDTVFVTYFMMLGLQSDDDEDELTETGLMAYFKIEPDGKVTQLKDGEEFYSAVKSAVEIEDLGFEIPDIYEAMQDGNRQDGN